MGNLRDLVEGRRTTAAVRDHGGGEGSIRGMVMSGSVEIATPVSGERSQESSSLSRVTARIGLSIGEWKIAVSCHASPRLRHATKRAGQTMTQLSIHKRVEAVERMLSPTRWKTLIQAAGALQYDATEFLDQRSA